MKPLGVFEVSSTGTRFVSARKRKGTGLGLLVGVLLGFVLGRRRR